MSKLQALRTEAGLTQYELAELLFEELPAEHESPRYLQPRISAYETERNVPPLPVALALVKILNTALKKAKSKTVAKVEDLA